ncbi:hypothetical protein B0J14DRAFT_706856 [Halenospora varia]|nr:hypothetical protein B0J14DRAFT_706856 [Halenospora varia]
MRPDFRVAAAQHSRQSIVPTMSAPQATRLPAEDHLALSDAVELRTETIALPQSFRSRLLRHIEASVVIGTAKNATLLNRALGAINAQTHRSYKDGFLSLLQIYDAKRGIQLVVDTRSCPRFHSLFVRELINIANKHGFNAKKGKTGTKEDLINFLMRMTKGIQEVSKADSQTIAKMLCDGLVASLTSKSEQIRWKKILTDPKLYQKTWNGGLRATPDVICHLQTAVGQKLQLAPTSNAGLLCGVRAPAASLHDVRYDIYRSENP